MWLGEVEKKGGGRYNWVASKNPYLQAECRSLKLKFCWDTVGRYSFIGGPHSVNPLELRKDV